MASDFNFNIEPGTDIPTSQASLAIRRKLAAALLQQGTDTSPVRAWSQGAARVAQGLLGGFGLGQADLEEANARKQAIADWTAGVNASGVGPQPSPGVASTLAGISPAGAPAPAPAPSPAPPAPLGAMPTQPAPGSAAARVANGYADLRGGIDQGIIDPQGAANNLGTPPPPLPPAPVAPVDRAPVAVPQSPPPLAPTAPAPSGGRSIDPRLMRALGNEFLPPAMGQIASGEINQQLAPPQLKVLKNLMGEEVPYTWDPVRQQLKPLGGGSIGGVPGQSTGDPADIAAAYEKQYPGVTARVEQLYRGEGAMPNARTNKIDAPAMQLIQILHPDWSMIDFKKKSSLITDLTKSSSGSMGGILANGKSAFGHLGTFSDALADLNNYSGPDVPGGAALGAIGNIGKNVIGARPSTKASMTAVTDAAGKYGAESTKFYSATGGAEGERAAALGSVKPGTGLAAEHAAFLRTERDLMMERFRQKERQIRDTLGQEYLDKNPVFDEDMKKAVDRVDRNIARLEGKNTVAPASAGAPPAADETKIIGGKTYIKRNGQWFEQ